MALSLNKVRNRFGQQQYKFQGNDRGVFLRGHFFNTLKIFQTKFFIKNFVVNFPAIYEILVNIGQKLFQSAMKTTL